MSLGILIIDLFQPMKSGQEGYTYPYGPVNLGLASVGKVLESAAAMNLKIFAAKIRNPGNNVQKVRMGSSSLHQEKP